MRRQAGRGLALVTGGGSGIGAACCRALAADGLRVIVADRDADAAAAVAGSIAGEALEVDVSQVDDAPTRLVSSLGTRTLDALVVAAGVSSSASVPNVSGEEWQRVLAVNLTGAFFSMQSLIGRLRRPGGAIVAVTSVEAFRVLALSGRSTPPYAAAKAGLTLAVESLATDLGADGIRVNAVAPGLIRTPMTAALPGDYESWIAQHVPLARWGEPEDVAEAVRWLCSPGADFVTGATLVVDGGLTLGLRGG
jgi:NAD(P)-dependent dehydrogenase (short-subunit alcohol dehydrogenase family)